MRKLIFLVLVILFAGYAGWAERRPVGHYLSDLRSEVSLNQGQPSERGNLLGVQPELFTQDYQSVERLRLKFHAYLAKARDEGLINPRTVVVFPEHIGTWLVAAGEKPEVYQTEHLAEAMEWMAASNPLKLARGWLGAKGEDRMADALFRMKAVDMAHDYQTLFGSLAKEFGVTIVAGSIVLPNPRIVEGQIRTGNGRLYNVSQVFGSDGLPLGKPQRKLFPIDDEKGFTRGGDADDLQVLQTPAGRLGVLVCADSWYPASYSALAANKPDIIAVPAFLTGNGSWSKPWKGYNGGATPNDVTLKPGELSEGEAWERLALAGRLGESGARAGITVFFRGHLWDLGSDGRSLVVNGNSHTLAPDGSGARLINLWL
ncbi:carbon-nitrogen hydrolase family protein [Pseudomonas sp. PDM20]|uniref:carbon-nitrogen hydrolase family protein n=1 Tax=Pseudomonas sp. PDM20 TaxID=2769254 RepID=UPI0017836464|nr:nitrilase-related carbon-nitrogen hydrolase [Pseudomonas sp. PDM20]MBD9681830.1 carbon-nitrogen hydrolase family protein [Pseudomonas sp. PDM20]